ncbi:hypothetical protein GCM10011575_42390 [Microlunatus endophyticus]|uniref:Uncharacterized protein n=1 Tax=Microlunatus endophyticus TaxID=1716077 RepID=A0A917SHT6_9ACTN|nr:hypothetical protein GCM10011575_42390 [Microlunatus endophyticus]
MSPAEVEFTHHSEVLTVAQLREPAGQSDFAQERVRVALASVAAESGHRGESEIDSSRPGEVVATWHAANFPLSDILDRALSAVRAVDPSANLESTDESEQ